MQKPHDKAEGAVIKRAARKHADEGHGGAWKVAFADFCLALLSLFLVLWLMAVREQQHMKETMHGTSGNLTDQNPGAIPDKTFNPDGSLIELLPLPHTPDRARGENAPPAPPRYETQADLRALSQVLATMSADVGLQANLETVLTPYGLRVMMHDTERQGMFVRGSALPTDRFIALLRKMGPLFAAMDNQMLVLGHTDSLQYANSEHGGYSNWTLSSNRAMSARAQLNMGGMHPKAVLQVVGMADRAPLDAGHPAAGVNRRIELLILTRGQARAIAGMYGVPGQKEALTKDIDTALPDVNALKQLREQLLPAAAEQRK